MLKKTKYWRRNRGFTFTPEVKRRPLIDSPMMTVINASAAETLLEQRPEKIQALSGIRTYDLCEPVQCSPN